MSYSEEENYSVHDDSESDGYGGDSPPKKKAAAKPKTVAKPKAAAKSKTATTSKVTKSPSAGPSKKAAATKAPLKAKPSPNGTQGGNDDDSDAQMDSGSDVDNFDGKSEAAPTPGAKGLGKDLEELGGQAGKGKTASQMYQKLSQIDHILKRPDSYIGSVQTDTQELWVFDSDTKRMIHKKITYVPGFFKIFDEILVNAADNKVNDPSMDTFKVVIDREKNEISVYNNGKGIPIEMHEKEKIWIPELIFGNLLTSSNYDDDEKKLTGGRNGFGAKLTNIYSTEFTIETADRNTGQKYKQTFSKNMSEKTKPKITSNPKNEEYTKITYKPDLARFSMSKIDDDTASLLMKRVYDMAGTVRGVKVWLDGQRLKIDGFKKYVEMYLASAAEEKALNGDGEPATKAPVIFETVSARWEVAFALAPEGEFAQVSFVNSIATIQGGTHVEAVAALIIDKLADVLNKKNKAAPIKAASIKANMWIFVSALIENPAFNSQTKEKLNTVKSKFGSKVTLSDAFMKKVINSGIVDQALSLAKFKQDDLMKKADGGKKTRISGILKLEDANDAGTKKGKDCTLILTEGDSAKALAVAGLTVVGRDKFGVFPLRGKLLNVREASGEQLLKNVEIQNIRTIMGFKHGKVYEDTSSLRYGTIMIMTDQDQDGSHIKGLIINFLDFFFPSLLKLPGFLVEFITPIVKCTKGKIEKAFYTLPEYEAWREENNDAKGWHVKYFKGLGTSTPAQAKKYFADMGKHMLMFDVTRPGDQALIDLAFNKKKADDRKEWLREFKPGTFLDQSIKTIPYADFINKELILFSMADNVRSIPSVVDGLKPGQRKVLFGCYLKKLKSEIKVAQLAGFVSEKTAYHHGEVSLTGTIVGLAQDFVGSNNINLLTPAGQYGTRAEGGKDHAAARYIFTDIPRINRAIFHPHDDPLLDYLTEDNDKIEPSWYVPVIPMVLVNGADGIGTGWSTQIPNYNPLDIIENLRRMMRGEDLLPMMPWWRGYGGTITKIADDKYIVSGKIEKISDISVEISELPIRKWTIDYKAMLESWITPPTEKDKTPHLIKAYDEHHENQTVRFVVEMSPEQMKLAEAEGLEKRFKIHSTLSTSNMVCFDPAGKIKKYSSAEEIVREFYPIRLEYYMKRKQDLTKQLTDQYEKLSNQARFVHMIITKELIVSNRKKAVIVDELRLLKFRPFPKSKLARAADEEEATLEEQEEGLASDYDYLLGMAIWSLTEEKVQKLLHEQSEKESELNELLKLTPNDLWTTDLDNLAAEWQLVLEADAIAQGSGGQAKKIKGKTLASKALAKAKKGKTADSDDDNSEEEYAPSKKKRPMPKKEAATSSAKILGVIGEGDRESTDRKPTPTKRKVSAPKTIKKEDTISDDDFEISPEKPAKVAKVAAAAKPSASMAADSGDEFKDVKPKVAARAKAAPKKPTYIESDDDEVLPAKQAPVRAAVLSDDDTEDMIDAAPLKVKARIAPTSKPVAKRAAKKIESETDDSMDAPRAKTTKAAPVFKASALPKKKKVDDSESEADFDDSLMGDDDDAPIVPRATSKRAAVTKSKAKPLYVDLDSD